MKRKISVLFAVVALLCAVGSAVPAAAMAGGGAHDVLRATLGNGLRVVIVRDPLAPVVTTVMNYDVGGDEADLPGLAHAQEHMMFRGSKALSANQYAAITAITGGAFDADTQSKITQFYYMVPSADLDIALHLEAARAQGLLDSQQQWDQERKAIEQEVTRDNSGAGYRLYTKVLGHVMAGTPYANNVLGTVKVFSSEINAPQLQAFYHSWYHPNNATFVIAGDVNPPAALAQVRRLFGGIPSQPLPARPRVHLRPLTPATYTDVSDQSYTLVLIGFRMPGYDSPRYAASVVLGDVLNNQRGALYDLVASGKMFDAGFQSQTFGKAGLGLLYAAVPSTMPPRAAVSMLERVIATYRRDGVAGDLVAAAKRREIASTQFARDSIEGLAFAWSQALAVEDRPSVNTDTEAVAGVSAQQVDAVLRRYLDTRTATLAYAVPRNGGAVNSAPFATVPENNTVIPTAHPRLPSWARRVLATLHVPSQSANPVSTVLPNGIRLVIAPETLTHTVELRGVIRTNPGLEEPPGQDGVASLTSSLLSYGTRSYDRVQYLAQLDRIAANVSTGSAFSLSVLSRYFDRGVALLADDELHPSFPAKDFAIVKQQEEQGISESLHAPSHLAAVALAKALYPAGDPARRFATPKSVAGLTLADARAWYRLAYRPDLTTIVVVGDVTPSQAKAAVERWFGAWKAEGPTPNVYASAVPNNAPASIQIPDTGRIQDSVSLSETLSLTRTNPDLPALRVANTVLSGGFYASLLYHDLREVKGYAYYVGTSLDAGRTRSIFDVEYGAMPGNVDKAQALIVADLERLRQQPLSAQRLTRAKALLMGDVPIAEQSYGGIADTLLAYASEGLPLDQELLEAREELAVTPAQLQAAMARWIRPSGFVRMVVGPAPAR